MIIAIDFDGTVVTHAYPDVGKNTGALPVLKRLVAAGHQIILWTMRHDDEVDMSKQYLFDAVMWFESRGIPLLGVNKNPDQGWSKSPKVYAQLYIDDAALGCPLVFSPKVSDRPFVDWERVAAYLEAEHIIPPVPIDPLDEAPEPCPS